MPVHGEFRMLAAHAQLARDGGIPEERDRARGERLGRRALAAHGARIVDRSTPA